MLEKRQKVQLNKLLLPLGYVRNDLRDFSGSTEWRKGDLIVRRDYVFRSGSNNTLLSVWNKGKRLHFVRILPSDKEFNIKVNEFEEFIRKLEE